MRDYFLQPLCGGHSEGEPIAASFDGDAEAMLHALSAAFPGGCEVWEAYRLVGRVYGPARHSNLAQFTKEPPDGRDHQIRLQQPQDLGTPPADRAA